MRLLFVLDGDRFVVGVITATDLLGEKPMRFVQERGGTRSDILVADIMTPASIGWTRSPCRTWRRCASGTSSPP